MQKTQTYCELETYALVHLSLEEVAAFVLTKEFRDNYHVNELKNFPANIILKLVCKPRIGIRALIG